MPSGLRLEIAGIGFAFNGCRQSGSVQLDGCYRPFVSHGRLDARYRLRRAVELAPSWEDCVFDSLQDWKVYQDSGKLIFRVNPSPAEVETVGVLEADFSAGDIYLGDSAQSRQLPITLMRLLTIGLLSQRRGVMMHASGIMADGTGILFSGTDGVGKSTTARLWERYTDGKAIGDDQIVVRQTQGRFWMYSTPWHGMDCTIGSVPVERIFIIRQGKENQIKPLSPGQAVAQLLKRSFPPLWSAEGMAFTLDFLGQLCASVPVYDFAFVPDQSAVEAIQCMDDA